MNYLDEILIKDESQINMMSPLTWAYVGDSVYELYIRVYLANTTNLNPHKMHVESIKYVKAGAQAKTVKELIETNPEASITRIKKLENLTDNKISNIVNNIPEEYLTQKHKKYIIKYISKRRDILLNMIKVEVNKK